MSFSILLLSNATERLQVVCIDDHRAVVLLDPSELLEKTIALSPNVCSVFLEIRQILNHLVERILDLL